MAVSGCALRGKFCSTKDKHRFGMWLDDGICIVDRCGMDWQSARVVGGYRLNDVLASFLNNIY